MPRVAFYTRVSTEEQATKYGLSSQLTELRAIAARAGYDVAAAAEYVDDGYSGADLNRPALDRLRAAVRAGAVELLFIHDPDRLSRKLAHQVLLMEEFERARVDVQFATITREATAEGRLLLQVKGVIAEYERTKIIERTSRGRREKARRGLVVSGTYAYGYRRDPAATGKLLVVEDEAAVVPNGHEPSRATVDGARELLHAKLIEQRADLAAELRAVDRLLASVSA